MTLRSPGNDRGLGRDRVDGPASGPSRGRWLSINEACEMLGVDQSTLRRWSDSGKVPVFRTPGGHRRYAEEDLRHLVSVGARRGDRPRVSSQQLTDRSLSGFEETFWQGARSRKWFRAFSSTKHEELKLLGRRLVDLAVRYAASPESADRSSWVDEGRQIGEQYGQSGARAGLARWTHRGCSAPRLRNAYRDSSRQGRGARRPASGRCRRIRRATRPLKHP